MSNEIKSPQYLPATGGTVYVRIRDGVTGQAWNGSAFETLNGSHWTNYAIACTEQGGAGHLTADFYANMPSGINTARLLLLDFYWQQGGSAALTDPLFATNEINWTGAVESYADSSTSIGYAGTVNLTNTVTTYTGNTPQTGDAYARIGANGAGLTSLAPAATALSTATWTNTLASDLAAIFAKLPANGIADETLVISATNAILTAVGSATLAATGLNNVLIDGVMLTKALEIMAATVAGVCTGGGTDTVTFKGLDGATTRAVAVMGASGNRTGVTYP